MTAHRGRDGLRKPDIVIAVCFAFDARPPAPPPDLLLPPIAGGAGPAQLELTSADGGAFSASLALSPDHHGAAVVILPDVRGLYPFYIELAERFAQAGHHAIAIDYFGRTAGLGVRDEDFDYMPHVMQTAVEQVQQDIAAAISALHDHTDATTVATVGFCFGGLQSFLAGTSPDLDLAGVVGFYAGLEGKRLGIRGPLERAGEIRGPLLGLFGGADKSITEDQVREFDRRLEAAGVTREIHIYPGAPHSFFDRRFASWHEACEDAWRRVLGFVEK